MLTVQIVGGVLLLVGIVLFVASQWSGGRLSTDDAGIKAWSINVSGPPGLILIIVGLAVFMYPLSPWWNGSLPTESPTTTTATTTTQATPTNPFIPTGTDAYWDELDTAPMAPYDVRFADPAFEPACSDTPTIVWPPGAEWDYDGWYLEIDVYDEGYTDIVTTYTWDSQYDEWVFGYDEYGRGVPMWCFPTDFNPALFYEVYIYAYNSQYLSVPTLIVY